MDDIKERVASFNLDEWENQVKSELPACRTHSLRAHGEKKKKKREKNSKQGTIKFWKMSVKVSKVKCQNKRIPVAPSSIFKPPLMSQQKFSLFRYMFLYFVSCYYNKWYGTLVS